jgi:nicotinamide-nucleotide amidase
MKAEIIAIGSELLTPYRLDTNSLYLTDRLNRLGIEVARKAVVGDDRGQLADAFCQSLGRAEVVISIGGLGPTEDDLTREALCDVIGRKLELHDAVLRGIEARFRKYNRKMAENNRRQAMVPEGAEILNNSRGTAPGLYLEDSGRVIVLLPGPPNELQGMWPQAEGRLGRRAGRVRLYTRELRVAGMPESEMDARIAPIYTTYSDVQTTVLAAPGEIQIHLRAWTADAAAAEKVLNEMTERIALALGEAVYTREGESLEEVVARQLNLNHATIAAAESCTGGLLSERLTRIPGSSSFFLGGMVCYANQMKTGWLDVPRELIDAKGAVSTEVAAALADSVRRLAGATLGVGITGIAGPGGGSPEKPTGTVHIALANGAAVKERAFHFPGDRERVRFQASQMALDMIRRYFLYGIQKAESRSQK